jgi:hypothetical protein
MLENPLKYYSKHSIMSDPGAYSNLFDSLPTQIDQLCRVVQGLMIHVFWAERYGVTIPGPRYEELQYRKVAQKLSKIIEIDNKPLTDSRTPENRLVGNCRDFTMMLTSMLRHRGIPARARCGFGRYFMSDKYVDHWVCEYWNSSEKRWILVDPQLDELQRDKLAIKFDTRDVPRDQFIVGGKAWRLCRTGDADPDAFGIFDMKGLWFVRGDLVRDIASLNKMELLPWDNWGLAEKQETTLSIDDLALLDNVAALIEGDVPEFEIFRQLYDKEDRLRVPKVIRSYLQTGPQEVDLARI